MDDLVRDAPDPVLPHPRAHLARVRPGPLRDVAPDWVHPRLGRTVEELLAALPPQGVRACYEPAKLAFAGHGTYFRIFTRIADRRLSAWRA